MSIINELFEDVSLDVENQQNDNNSKSDAVELFLGPLGTPVDPSTGESLYMSLDEVKEQLATIVPIECYDQMFSNVNAGVETNTGVCPFSSGILNFKIENIYFVHLNN